MCNTCNKATWSRVPAVCLLHCAASAAAPLLSLSPLCAPQPLFEVVSRAAFELSFAPFFRRTRPLASLLHRSRTRFSWNRKRVQRQLQPHFETKRLLPLVVAAQIISYVRWGWIQSRFSASVFCPWALQKAAAFASSIHARLKNDPHFDLQHRLKDCKNCSVCFLCTLVAALCVIWVCVWLQHMYFHQEVTHVNRCSFFFSGLFFYILIPLFSVFM